MTDNIFPYSVFQKHALNNDTLTQEKIYYLYLKTDRWQELRNARMELDNHRCRMCDVLATCVHHRRYPDILGEETVDDLTSLCTVHHEHFHHPPSIVDVKQDFFKVLSAGKHMDCPLCGRYAKYELRPLNATMARSLVWIVRTFEATGDWVDVPKQAPKWLIKTNQHTTLAKWGLLERGRNVDPTKNHSGLWRPTKLGINFVNNGFSVPWKVCLWDDTKIGITKEEITIHEALSAGGFDYQEVLKNPNEQVEPSLTKYRIKKESNVVYH